MELGEIRTRTEKCKSLFTQCLSIQPFSGNGWFEIRQGEFNLWITSLKAADIGRSSLDYRVRDSLDIRELICDLLDGLSEALETLIQTNKLENVTSTSKSETDSLSEQEDDVGSVFSGFSTDGRDVASSPNISDTKGLFAEHIFNVRTILGQLTRISTAIRRSGAKYRYRKADSLLKMEDFKDFKTHLTVVVLQGNLRAHAKKQGNATTMLSHLTDSQRLTQVQNRLIHANIVRRNRIMVATRHMKVAENSAVKDLQKHRPVMITDILSATAKTGPELALASQLSLHEPAFERSTVQLQTPSIKTSSMTQTATELGSQFNLQRAIELKNPTPSIVTRVTKIGAAQDYPGCPEPTSDFLQCPYCADMLPAAYSENQSRWRGHVAQDILPYVCVNDDCKTPDEMYLTSDDLLKHMCSEHGVTHWICGHCASRSEAGQPYIFRRLIDWESHMKTEHMDVHPSRLQSLAKLSQRRLLEPISCPLCSYFSVHPQSTLDDHIAKHLHEFALRCLPWGTGRDDVESVDMKDVNLINLNYLHSENDEDDLGGDLAHLDLTEADTPTKLNEAFKVVHSLFLNNSELKVGYKELYDEKLHGVIVSIEEQFSQCISAAGPYFMPQADQLAQEKSHLGKLVDFFDTQNVLSQKERDRMSGRLYIYTSNLPPSFPRRDSRLLEIWCSHSMKITQILHQALLGLGAQQLSTPFDMYCQENKPILEAKNEYMYESTAFQAALAKEWDLLSNQQREIFQEKSYLENKGMEEYKTQIAQNTKTMVEEELRLLGAALIGLDGERGATPKERITFRVAGIPDSWDHGQLQSFLSNQGGITDVAIESLASEDHGGSQVATVTFANAPRQHDRRWLIPIHTESNYRPEYLIIDKDFLGMTVLYTPPPQDHKIDIIAIPGLGGHAFGSFVERGGSHMWLRDSLPFDLTLETSDDPLARVMIYGYDSTVGGDKSMQNIEDLATRFNAGLRKLANASIIRPIILIGHSLGGLIIKQALISLSKSEHKDDRNLIRAIYGVVFFGTPHDGMGIASLITMTGDSSLSRFLAESLSRNTSQILTIQQRDFHRALGDKGNSEVFCFYETLESPAARRDESVKWGMTGPAAVLVTESSATHCRPWEDEAEHICAINRMHSDMVKFGPHDLDYNNVREKLKGLSRRAFKTRDRLRASGSMFLVPYSRNPNFITRSKFLNEIKKQFGSDQQGEPIQSHRRVSLHGLGGVGKTQIAIAYAYWLKETDPDISVFWVHASDKDCFRRSYASIAKRCNIPGSSDPEADILVLVSNWLKQQTKMRWLIVIDNADDMDMFFPDQFKMDAPGEVSQTAAAPTSGNLARYIPDCSHGSILITTGNKKTGVKLCQGLSSIEIGKMTDDEAYQLVQVMMKNQKTPTDGTIRLLSKLEHLPLALTRAVSYIQKTDISIDEYVQLLEESDSFFIGQLSESFKTWIVSFELIRKKEMLASDILSFLSFFHFHAIPKVFVEDYYRQRYPEQISSGTSAAAARIKALGTLKAFGFISEEEDKSFTMHRLVQLVAQKWVIDLGQVVKFATFAMKTMSAFYPDISFETRKICLKYLPHAYAVLEKTITALNNDADITTAIAKLLGNMAGYYLSTGECEKAEDLATRTTEILKSAVGKYHPDTARAMDSLRMVYEHQSRFEEAEDIGVQVLEISKNVLGEEHPDTLARMGALAIIYAKQNRWKEAEYAQLQVVETCKRVLGEEHPETLTSLNNLSLTYRKQGQWTKAEALTVQMLEIFRRVLGKEHPKTAACMANLSLIYLQQHRLEEAENLAVEVMEIHKSALGEEHPEKFLNMNNMAYIYYRQGLLKKAEVFGAQLIEVENRVLGEDNEVTLISLKNLMLVYQSQGRWREARDLGIRVLEAEKRKLGEEHPSVLDSMHKLSMIYQHLSHWEEAEVIGTRLIELTKRMLGEGHYRTLIIRSDYSRTLKGLGRTSEAITVLADSVAGLEKILGHTHPDTAKRAMVLEQWRKSAQDSPE